MIRQRTITPLTRVEEHFLDRATPFPLTTALSANWFESRRYSAQNRVDAQGLLGTFYCS